MESGGQWTELQKFWGLTREAQEQKALALRKVCGCFLPAKVFRGIGLAQALRSLLPGVSFML